jgi:excisionase family DNA binding protein
MTDDNKPQLPEEYAHRSVLLKEEVAKIYRVSVRTIERRIEEGTIPVIKLGDRGVTRIPAEYFRKK